MRICFYTLGCKVNQHETSALARLFCENGYVLAGPDEEADVYVVNSCTVTAGGDKKSRQWLRRARRQNPGAVTVLVGCYPQAFPAEAAAVAEADVVMGNTDRAGLLRAVQTALDTGERVVEIRPHAKGEAFEELPISRPLGHTRAFIKVEDGCNRQCAYCVIPRARGLVRSRSRENVLDELRALAQNGCREVVFSGINLPSYGLDTGDDLAGLVEAAAGVEGIRRIRLSSLEPDLLPPDTIARLAAVPKLCPQFHLSLQSGCTATLRRMRRVYTAEEYAAVGESLRKAFGGHASLTTDVIVGFAGESEEEFCESLAFVRAMRFLKVHVFPYSARPGTPAASFAGQVSEAEKADRVRRMQAAADDLRAELICGMAGERAEILLETPLSGTVFTGYTRRYVPVAVSTPGCQKGQIIEASLGEWDGERCRASFKRLL